MSKELPKTYDPKKVEDKIYETWEKSGYFNPDKCERDGFTNSGKNFSIILPPPNVTGNLHMGHAAMLAIEDAMIRYHRMNGDRALWIPGTDHAAIATQEKVEKIIYDEEKKTRHDLGRKDFLKRVEKFAQESHDTIVNQVKKMGSSIDWSREAYTLDEQRNLAVRTAFKKMYDDGIIYRGHRIVNWDPKLNTTVSDDEVERRTEKTTFYYLKYGPFEIGTARPETKFGDKYVVMHPKDKRYADYEHGQKIDLEWINGPITATVIKDEAIDMDFGTGVMTITPWHDTTDFEIAERHDLEKEQIIDYDGKLLDIAGEFSGMDISEAREKIVAKLDSKGLLSKKDDNYEHNIAINSRGEGIIEPQIKEQWFVDVNKEFKQKGKRTTLKKLMQNAVKSNDIEIIPKRFEKIYFHWIDNLRDWCISRQIWYGHRIPVYFKSTPSFDLLESYKKGKQEIKAGEEGSPVHEKKEKEYRLVLSDKKDFDWFMKNFKETGGYEYADFFDRKNRTRVSENSFTTTSKEAPKSGVVHKKGKKGEIDGIYATIEERSTSGFSRYEIEFKGGLPEYFKNYKQVASTDILNYQNEEKTNSAMLVSVFDPIFDGWKQDPDTLDTWFSSGLWTFSTLGWPNETDDLKNYHPTSVMETGYDILFFWVARMILMSTYLLDGEIPFEKVYLHGLVRDEKGRKMSKSLGNIIDPLDVAEKYGTDAVRLSLMIGTTPGNDVRLNEEKIARYRNFTNKIWNISRFTIHKTINRKITEEIKGDLTISDFWILGKMRKLISEVSDDMENFRFSQAGERLHDFTWNDFADWYLEVSKFEDNKAKDSILIMILKDLLKLWHPFMPYVTEHIWDEIGNDKLLLIEKWPNEENYSTITGLSDADSMRFKLIQNIITAIRNARVENKIEPKKKIKIIIDTKNVTSGVTELVTEQKNLIKSLRTGISELKIKSDDKKVAKSIHRTVSGINIYIPTEGLIDIEKEKKKTEKELENLEKYISGIKRKLKNNNFTEKAPEKIVKQEKEKLEKSKTKYDEIKKHIKELG